MVLISGTGKFLDSVLDDMSNKPDQKVQDKDAWYPFSQLTARPVPAFSMNHGTGQGAQPR